MVACLFPTNLRECYIYSDASPLPTEWFPSACGSSFRPLLKVPEEQECSCGRRPGCHFSRVIGTVRTGGREALFLHSLLQQQRPVGVQPVTDRSHMCGCEFSSSHIKQKEKETDESTLIIILTQHINI